MPFHTLLMAAQIMGAGATLPPGDGTGASGRVPACDSALTAVAPSPSVLAGVLASIELHGAVVRWRATDGAPVRVWIQPRGRRGPGEPTPAEWRHAVVQAVDAWGRVPAAPAFRIVDDSAAAAVRVVWAPSLAAAGPAEGALASFTAGRTVLAATLDGAIETAVVTLAQATPAGTPYSRRDVTAVALHELGHALGLAHRADPRSVMSPLVLAEAVAPVDAATIRALYAAPLGLRCAPTPPPPGSPAR